MEHIETIIVTRHASLISHLRKLGYEGTVYAHATPELVTGKRVVGVLPLHLAALAEEVVVVDLDLPQEMRGVELTEEQVAQYARSPRVYRVMGYDAAV